ncbi:MAG: glycosyltransferase [Spirochaetales bacterium]|nr:glycosyltransferase [Spirochaetales bacterium]
MNKLNINISIILPVYNTGPYLKKCIDSVLNQTLENIEIIIINDASTDNSLSIIKEYVKNDSRIKVVSLSENTPGGAGIPSNIGIEQAKGEYIGFVDSDDWLEPDMFETLYKNAVEHDSDYTFCDFQLFNEKTGKITTPNDKLHWESLNTSDKSSLLKLSPVPWRKLYKRSFLMDNNLRFPEGDFFYEDTPFHFMVTLKAKSISFVDRPLYYHRVSRAEQTMNGKGRKFFAFIQHIKTIYQYLEKEDYIQKYPDDFLIFIINNFYWIWDRLNRVEREEFFFELNTFLKVVAAESIEKFIKEAVGWDSIRLEQLYKGNFKQYKRTMIKFKTRTGIFLRAFDYLNENGLTKTVKRIL